LWRSTDSRIHLLWARTQEEPEFALIPGLHPANDSLLRAPMLASERSCSQENESYSFRIECCPESRLLLEARRGNQAAFGELCQRHSGSTLRI